MIITVSGPHGTGKSTYAAQLADALRIRHVSAGAVFRRIAKEKKISLEELGEKALDDPSVDRLVDERRGISLLYITPLRALNRDLLKRLQIWSVKLGFTVEVRHGDTPAADRRRMAGRPPDLLITTPETLQAVLPGKRMRQHLRHVKAVVVDEVHELAGNRRGVQLTVGLDIAA